MNETDSGSGSSRTVWRALLWAWIAVMLALYLQTFEATIRLLAGVISGWIV